MQTGIKIRGTDLFDLGKRLVEHVGGDDVSGLAAEMAYRFFLAIFPFFIFLAALGGFVAAAANVDNPTDEVMDLIGDALPDETSAVLRGELQNVLGSENPGLLSFGIVGTILAAAGGMNSVVKGFNRAYNVKETRPFWMKMPLTVGLVLLGGFSIVGAFILLIMGTVYGQQLANELGLGTVAGTLFTFARWPIVALMVLIAVAFLYWAAPNVKLPFRLISPGAVFFLIVWLTATWLFGFYVSNFGDYNATYGTLGAVVILMIWFYLTGFVLLLGAEINALLAHVVAPEELEEEERQKFHDHAIPDHKEEAIRDGRAGREPVIAFQRDDDGDAERRRHGSSGRRPEHDREFEREVAGRIPSRKRATMAEKTGFSVLGALVAGVAAWRLIHRD